MSMSAGGRGSKQNHSNDNKIHSDDTKFHFDDLGSLPNIGFDLGDMWDLDVDETPEKLVFEKTEAVLKQLMAIDIYSWCNDYASFAFGFLKGIEISEDPKQRELDLPKLNRFLAFVEKFAETNITRSSNRRFFVHYLERSFKHNCPWVTEKDATKWNKKDKSYCVVM